MDAMLWWPVPLLALVVFLIAGAQVGTVLDKGPLLLTVLPVFIGFLLAAALLSRGLAGSGFLLPTHLSRLDAVARDFADAADTVRWRGHRDCRPRRGHPVRRLAAVVPVRNVRCRRTPRGAPMAGSGRAGGYVMIRDRTCRLFGYHGLMARDERLQPGSHVRVLG